MKAVFFDRDNTIIKDKSYMYKPEDLDFYPDSFSALKSILAKGYELFIITNQSGVGRGYFSLEQMHQFHQVMLEKFLSHGISFKELKFCPHSPEDNCNCRKPHPTLILECIEKYSIDTKESFMIGDKIIDAQCGERAGINGVTINCKTDSEFKNYSTLSEFADSLK